MTSRYARSLDLTDLNAHTYGVLLAPAGGDVLDVGTADGHPVVAALVERGCRVWGVEVDAAAAAAAAPLCEDLAVGSVEDLDLQARWPDLQVDAVLCLDVLEHLVDPVAALRKLRPLLRPGGRLVISVPNVTHAAVRLQLLAGRFTYTESGLLDGTHLRFFDREHARSLVEDAGCHVVEELAVLREPHETEIPVDLDQVRPEILEEVRRDPDALVFQWVLVVEPGPAGSSDARTGLATALFARLQEERGEGRRSAEQLEELRGHLAEAAGREAAAEQVVSTLRARLTDLDAILRERSAELDDATVALAAARASLAVKDAYIAEIDGEPAPTAAAAAPAPRGGRALALRTFARLPRTARLVRATYRRLPAGVQRRIKG